MIQDIQTSDEFSFDVINKDGFVLVDFLRTGAARAR